MMMIIMMMVVSFSPGIFVGPIGYWPAGLLSEVATEISTLPFGNISGNVGKELREPSALGPITTATPPEAVGFPECFRSNKWDEAGPLFLFVFISLFVKLITDGCTVWAILSL